MMAKRKTITAFELRIEAAAAPMRVAIAADLLGRLLEASSPSLPQNSVTIEVRNFDTKAYVHPWTRAGEDATQRILKFLRDPEEAVRRSAAARRIAAVLAQVNVDIKSHGAVILDPRRARKPLAIFDEEFIDRMKKLADYRPVVAHRGTTDIYSSVLRVGRTDEDKRVRARVKIDDRFQDINIAEDAEHGFWAAAESKRTMRITLDAAWERTPKGEYAIVPSATTAIAITEWSPLSGKEFLEVARSSGDESMFEGDLDDIIADIEGR